MRTVIENATVVNEGRAFNADVVIDNDVIADIIENKATPRGHCDRVVDAAGCFLLPGVIDDHVHFREPGLTHKADIESESRAAAYGGVTSYFDMPNTKPQTTTLAALDEKRGIAKLKSHVNYSFFIGATNDNLDQLLTVDKHRVPGVKLFMGSSTGNMLVDDESALARIFGNVKLPIMTHCEDTALINENMQSARARWGEDPAVIHHPWIRNEEACYRSTLLAVSLARKYGARLHVAHLTTARELQLFVPDDPQVTAEAVVAHLLFSDRDYKTLGSRIKCNPAVKTIADREALRKALSDGRIALVGTDHAPHAIEEKQGGCCKAMSGMPMLQFSLVAMLGLVDESVLTIERLVELMCHNPARIFDVSRRGYIRKGYKADIVVVRPNTSWTVDREIIQSKCKWSPVEGRTFKWKVEHTFCNGVHVLDNDKFDENYRGEELMFRE